MVVGGQKNRKAINEIDKKSFWRVTFDNFDFRMRFAKKNSRGWPTKEDVALDIPLYDSELQ